MLSRTADNLYWLARYVERAEYLARILEATQRLTTLPLSYVGSSNEWASALATAGCNGSFAANYDEATEENVKDFIAFSPANPSSIRNCIESARNNARAVRTALTMEMWDAINGAWLELKRYGNGPSSREEFSRFLRWVQETSMLFDPSSLLGVPGLMAAYLKGNVTIVNAPGTGIADDKAIYSYMPEIMRFYLGEDAILKNVPTWRCREEEHLKYVLDNLEDLVVKEVHGSGGYGMLIGPTADKATISNFRAKLKTNPKNFIAQPTLALSTCPTFVEQGIAPRHVDLRPFVLTGRDSVRIVPGGLTRVALKQGSLVVNSSQGGGTKDTWVLDS